MSEEQRGIPNVTGTARSGEGKAMEGGTYKPPGQQGQDEGQAPEPDPSSAQVTADGSGVPDGTVAEVIAWVGDDPDRAAAALEVENESARPRSTLIAALEPIAAEGDDQ